MDVDVRRMDEDECKSLMLSLGLTGCFMVIHLADSMQQLTNQMRKKHERNEITLYQKLGCKNRIWRCIIQCAEFFISALNLHDFTRYIFYNIMIYNRLEKYVQKHLVNLLFHSY